jgi:hypothetical protein
MDDAEHMLEPSSLPTRVSHLQDSTFIKHSKDMKALDHVITRLNELDEDSATMLVDSESLTNGSYRVRPFKHIYSEREVN